MDYICGQHQPYFDRMGSEPLKKRLIIIWPSIINFSANYVITSMTTLCFEGGIKERSKRLSVQQQTAPTDQEMTMYLSYWVLVSLLGLIPIGLQGLSVAMTCKIKSQISSCFLCSVSIVRKRLERSLWKME